MAKRYTVTYERDEDGWWVATVHGIAGVHTQGRTIAEARRFARDALAAALGREKADEAELLDDVRMPPKIRVVVDKQRVERRAAEDASVKALAYARSAAKGLRKSLGLSVRDIAELLEISHQRVHQLLSDGSGRP